MKVEEFRGLEGLYAAEVLTDTTEGITFGTPFQVCELAQMTRTTETSSETKFYNNRPAIVIDGVGSDTVTLECSVIPDEALAKITGQDYNAEKGMFVEGEGEKKYFAIGYVTRKVSGAKQFIWRLKGKFNIPDDEASTINDGTDSNGQTLEYAGINTTAKFTATGKTAKAVRVDSEVDTTMTEATWYASVQTPDTIAPAA